MTAAAIILYVFDSLSHVTQNSFLAPASITTCSRVIVLNISYIPHVVADFFI
jgi:hypothetical protein